jgi:hypothetical protein
VFLDERRRVMIVEKRTYRVKGSSQDAVVEMIKEGHKVLDFPLTFRIYLPIIAPWGVIVHEIEFKDLAERQTFWESWYASDQAPAFIEKWFETTKDGGGSEIWNLAD